MKEGLHLALQLGFSRIVAESDSTEVVEACSGEGRWWDESTAIYADCVDMVVSIGHVSFSHIPMEANQVAHTLARESFS
jgi:ribonuclease HI